MTGIKCSKLEILVGEDVNFGGNDLFIDLIPTSCWFKNARTDIHPQDWDRIREFVYSRKNYTCECCGNHTKISGDKLEAHERWEYNNETKTQRLARLVALCEKCHLATHMGRANNIGRGEEARDHLIKVRGFTEEQFDEHYDNAWHLFCQRSKKEWNLDLSLLTNNGIKIYNDSECLITD